MPKATLSRQLEAVAHPLTGAPADWHNAGHLEVQLHGRKLKGNFALIRMAKGGQKVSWLLIKMQDAEARPDPVAAERTTTAPTPP